MKLTYLPVLAHAQSGAGVVSRGVSRAADQVRLRFPGAWIGAGLAEARLLEDGHIVDSSRPYRRG
jgi:hypothetical protein